MATPLNVSWEQLDAGQQTADAFHVAVTISSHPVVNTLHQQELLAEGLKRSEDRRQRGWLHDRRQRGEGTGPLGPEVLFHHTVGAEDDHQPLSTVAGGSCSRQTWQSAQKRQSRRGDAKPFQNVASGEHGYGAYQNEILFFQFIAKDYVVFKPVMTSFVSQWTFLAMACRGHL